jgi:tRNA A37 threonylcarbamoyladenosine modification protein TsaB
MKPQRSSSHVLILDSSRRGELTVAIANGRVRVLRHRFDTPGSGQLLNLVEQLLHREKVALRELTGIVVASGPGPFSALRAAASIANAMGYALDIPVVGIAGEHPVKELARRGMKKLARTKSGVIVVPHYGRPAHITKPPRR